MGSSKKQKKDKDREREKDVEKIKTKKRKHKSKSRSPTSPPTTTLAKISKKDKSHKKRKEKRRHSESADSDVPLAKSAKYGDHGHGSIPDVPTPRSKPISRSPSPPARSSGGGGDVSLSVHETNKLRIKLGLKPLQVESAQPATLPPPIVILDKDGEPIDEKDFDEETLRKIREEREKEGETFWKEKKEFVHAPAENLGEKIQAEKIREKIRAVREKRRLEEKLAGVKGLAESDDDEIDDAHKWIERQRKAAQQKALADKRAKALAELDDEFGVGDLVEQDYQRKKNTAYTGQDLKGLKVLHSQTRIDAGASVILTLRDKGVLDEDDDTLVNVNMVDDEKFEKNIETRRLRPELHGYSAYDEIEFDNQGNLLEKGVLSKYDEEIDKSTGVKSFVIGEDLSEEVRKARIREKMQKANKILESLEGSQLQVASDFYTPDEMVSFRKTKKKVRKRKSLRADDLIKIDSQQSSLSASSRRDDRGSRSTRGKAESTSKHPGIKNEAMDMEIDLELDDMPPVPYMDDADIWTVKVEDEADRDFQMALNKARKLKQKKVVKQNVESLVDKLHSELQPEDTGDQTGNIVLHATAEFCRTLGDIPSVDGVDIYGDEEMDFETEEKADAVNKPEERGRWAEVEIDETPVDVTREPEVEEAPILEQEPTVGSGLAGALRLAMKKGYLDQEVTKRGMAGGNMKHLEAQNYSIEDKNYEDDRIQKRDMYAGPTTDFKEKESYKPDVKLDYVDEEGKPISSKEAFRLLSHKFHGKGSGKNKVDKKRRKHEQEKLMQHMNSSDTPLGTLELLQQKQKETQSAFIILTGKAQHALIKSNTNKR